MARLPTKEEMKAAEIRQLLSAYDILPYEQVSNMSCVEHIQYEIYNHLQKAKINSRVPLNTLYINFEIPSGISHGYARFQPAYVIQLNETTEPKPPDFVVLDKIEKSFEFVRASIFTNDFPYDMSYKLQKIEPQNIEYEFGTAVYMVKIIRRNTETNSISSNNNKYKN